jgi:hypothetical protein
MKLSKLLNKYIKKIKRYLHIRRGLLDSAAGRVKSLGSFKKYTKDK